MSQIVVTGTEESFELFAEDVMFEFPYATSLGMPGRFEGKEIAINYLRQMLSQLKGLKLYNFRSYPVEGDCLPTLELVNRH